MRFWICVGTYVQFHRKGPGVVMHTPDNDISDSHHSTASESAVIQTPPTINEKALVRKIDFRLLPVLFVIYLAAFLDRWVLACKSTLENTTKADCDLRVNISNALIMGLPKDLHLKGNQTNVALTIFFVPYILFEIPSNIFLKKLKPHVWRMFYIIQSCTWYGFLIHKSVRMYTRIWNNHAGSGLRYVLFSCIYHLRHTSSQATVKNYSGLLATRFFLGLAEAGIFPGSTQTLAKKLTVYANIPPQASI